MPMKVFFISLGCDKNLVDSERMLGSLAGKGYVVTDSEDEADVIVINTCCFIDKAKEESIENILEMARYKTEGRCKALIVAGCMAERYRQEILDEIPEVDAIVGTGSFHRIEDAVEAAVSGNKNILIDELNEQSASAVSEPQRMMTTGGHYEYLKIAEGCDKHCTYCIIPKLRGKYYSVPMEKILSEAEYFARQGVKELILVAEETTLYGVDLYGRKSLHLLIKGLCRIPEIEWIRILYCYPEEIYPQLIQVIKEEPKVCHYLDMPIQHINDDILKRMGRRTTKQELIDTIRRLRKEIPDIALRTSLITGFPGETEEQHRELMDFVRETRFDRLGVFTYSQEEDTPAALLPDQIDDDVKVRRQNEILALQQEISYENGRDRIGQVMDVHIEGYMSDEDSYVGRTYADTPGVDGYFFIETDEVLHSGDMVKAKVTGAMEYDLIGKLEGDFNNEFTE